MFYGYGVVYFNGVDRQLIGKYLKKNLVSIEKVCTFAPVFKR